MLNNKHKLQEEEDDNELTLEELTNRNAIKNKLCKEWMLCNEWIGNFVSSNQNEYYARKLVEIGYDSVEIIESDLVFLANNYTELLNFMDPLHKEVFIGNILKEYYKRLYEIGKVRRQNARHKVPAANRRRKARKHHIHIKVTLTHKYLLHSHSHLPFSFLLFNS